LRTGILSGLSNLRKNFLNTRYTMSSVTSSLKQIPLNGGYFRSVSASTAGDVSGFIYDLAFNAAGAVTSATLFTNSPAISAYNGLLRDMGAQYVYGGYTYRRVQIVPATVNVDGGAASPADDGDYLVGYIRIGRTGGTPSVFVRTG